MDSGSHLLFGISLAGLACLAPGVVQEPTLVQAILAGTLVGSYAPDFDTVARLRGYGSYVRIHRGVTHSLPALFIWPLLISLPLAAVFGVWEHYFSLFLWTFLAVVCHVGLDALNVYGVQCLRPFTKKWIHLDTLCLYDPFLFVLHAVGAILWFVVWRGEAGSHIGEMYALIFAATILYIATQASQRKALVKLVQNELKLTTGVCRLVPSLSWFYWQFIYESETSFFLGELRSGKVIVLEQYSRKNYNSQGSHPIVKATMGTEGVRSFLHYAQNIYVSWKVKNGGYEVQWRDIRFWHKRKFSFGVDVHLDGNMNVVSDRIGMDKKAWDPPYV
ncbi:metal-dependent hydrolase [Paenibacillus qinlingensis]|uniref:metal-dependent hydrolase n=1 Tax=Paenibacillus qinlingensis TaxID=1837343 RepID=UPI001566ED31|nr:metal-dependent hydrolase [Paenibacillus qinlingensis]NQX63232.1 metal-dependent hydrolase [Paenibacillus qinlingensis]